jgi:threonine/homoserine/homoserine lactone efflux protein
MPSFSNLELFFTATVLVVITPGPDMVYVINHSLRQGRVAGIVSALGILVGNLGHTVAAIVGLSALIMASALAYNFVKYAGAAYLIYLGIQAFLSKENNVSQKDISRAKLKTIFFQAILTNLLNPKAVAFFLAFLPQFIDTSDNRIALQIAVLGSIIAIASSFWLMILVVTTSSFKKQISNSRKLTKLQNLATGSVLVLLGLRLAISEGLKS